MNILITHVYAKANKGDAAILSVLISELNRVFPNPHCTISTMENFQPGELVDGCSQLSSFSSLALLTGNGKVQKLGAMLYVLIVSLFWSFGYRIGRIRCDFLLTKPLRELLHCFSLSDLIVPVGGGYLRGKDNLEENISIVFLVLPLLIGRILKKPVVLYSQSIGPFGTQFQSRVVSFALKHVTGILVREAYSLKACKQLHIPANLLHKTIDAGFLFTTQKKYTLRQLGIQLDASHPRLVGITVRKWLSHTDQQAYETAIASVADFLIQKKACSVVFISQVTSDMFFDDDRLVAASIVNKMKEKKHVWNLTKNYSHSDIKAIYHNLDYLIGTRLHSVIFSLTSAVPAIAIAYEHKTRGVFADLKLSAWVINIEDVSSEALIDLYMSLTKHRKSYLKILHTTLPRSITKAKQAANIIHDLYMKEQGKGATS